MELQIFMIKRIPKVNSNHTFLAVISSWILLSKSESYYLQVF